MNENMNSRFLIEKVFEVIHRNKLDYCVQNKYEMMPDEMPSDIDMFYRNASEKDLDQIVMEVCEATSTVVTQKIATGYYQFTYNLSHTDITTRFQFQLDFYKELSSSRFPHVYLPEAMLSTKRHYKCFYVPLQAHEVCYQTVRRIMKKDMDREHFNEIRRLYKQNPKEANQTLIDYWGDNWGKQITTVIVMNNLDWFSLHYAELRKVLSINSQKNTSWKLKLKQWIFNFTRFIPYRVFCPVGMSIALLAPDGGGKSTIISKLTDSCSGSFDIQYKYFRPGLFKNVGQYRPNAAPEPNDNPNPHGKTPNGLIKSFMRYFIYNIDFLLGYLCIVWPLKIKRKLIIFDRYYYDYYADIYRYHYSFADSIPHMFSFMIPSPDLIFVLDAPAEVLYKRKKELPVEEIDKQRKAFLKFAHNKKNAFVIDVNRPLDDIVKDITSCILITKSKQVQNIFRNKR